MTFDVVVLGGGPAGTAAAIRLAADGLQVAQAAKAPTCRPHVGETFGPECRDALEEAGLGHIWEEVPNVPFRSSVVSWGSESPNDRLSIVSVHGEGVHVDRQVFDALLAEAVPESGVAAVDASVAPRWCDDHWQMGDGTVASHLINATGRGSAFKVAGQRWVSFDRLVGVSAWFSLPNGRIEEPELMVEATETGWWYSASQPRGGLVATFMTDSDLVRAKGRSGLKEFWRSALQEAPLTRSRLNDGDLLGQIEVYRADSGFSAFEPSPHWSVAGDASMAWDPLAGIGVARALRSGVSAAIEAEEWLAGRTRPGHPTSGQIFEDYLSARSKYYKAEQRWPESPFWARRHAPNLDDMPFLLGPEEVLEVSATTDYAMAESLVGHQAVRELMQSIKVPLPAHEALRILKEASALTDDRRLFAGLQCLVAAGCLSRVSASH